MNKSRGFHKFFQLFQEVIFTGSARTGVGMGKYRRLIPPAKGQAGAPKPFLPLCGANFALETAGFLWYNSPEKLTYFVKRRAGGR